MLGGYVRMFTFTVMMLGKLNKTEVRSKPKSLFFYSFKGSSLPLCCRNVLLHSRTWRRFWHHVHAWDGVQPDPPHPPLHRHRDRDWRHVGSKKSPFFSFPSKVCHHGVLGTEQGPSTARKGKWQIDSFQIWHLDISRSGIRCGMRASPSPSPPSPTSWPSASVPSPSCPAFRPSVWALPSALPLSSFSRWTSLESLTVVLSFGHQKLSFQTSWFVAWLSLDQQRIENRKHGIIPCVTVEKVWESTSEIQKKHLGTLVLGRDAHFFASGVWPCQPRSRETSRKAAYDPLCFSPWLLLLQGA